MSWQPPAIGYFHLGSIVITFNPVNFIAEDAPVVHDNVSTSGFRERVYESSIILISFTLPGLLAGNDFADWKKFYAWALPGGTFQLNVNPSLFPSFSPFNCVLEDSGFKPKRVGFQRYSIDCKFRVVPDSSAPANAGLIMDAFWGSLL